MKLLPGRTGLAGAWALAPGGPGGEAPGDAAWQTIDGPQPVAAALAASNAWHLDGPARDFDAECWWYRCRFDAPAAWQAGKGGTLGLDGLATIASVWLNGEPLLDSRNMFQAHALPVGERLRAEGNELLIRFDPLSAALAQRRARPRWRAPMVAHQQLRWWRTTLLGRTPGWSPPAAVVGPWQPLWLQPAGAGWPSVVELAARLVGGLGELSVRAVGGASGLRLRLLHAGQVHEVALVPSAGQGGDGNVWQAALVIDEVQPWWPHTHGEPVRHGVQLVSQGPTGEQVLDLGQVGFRAVQADTSGGGFSLVVNGEPVFARGLCWVPLDTLRLHAEPAQYRAVLTRLRDAGVNMVRVGGTMAYESDAFFELCDELGLMVWQELMFANMDYPADDAGFAAEVDAELASQLPRWAARACVVAVCGNSEVEQQAAMWGAGREHWQPALFHERIAGAVAQALPGAVYWPSSAHGGAFPFQPNTGTTSYYGVGAYRRPLADACASGLRFATECLAFAQVPTDATLARLRALNADQPLRTHSPLWKARAPRDLGAGWDFDDVRDHYVQHLFGEDPQALRMSDPVRHLLLGRAAAAEAVQAAFDQWRAAGSACRGAMVWFLRDLWAGAGWGYLDDQAQPKAVFHALARVCQPLHLGVTDEGLNGLVAHAVNERGEAAEGELSLVLYRDGEWPVAQASIALQLPARSVQAWPMTDFLDGFVDASWAYRFGPPPADVLVLQWRSADRAVQRVHFIDAGPLQRRELGLAAQAREAADGQAIELTVRSRAAARGVHVEAEGWSGDDDSFDLAPGGERLLRFLPWPGQPRRAWRASVTAINALQPVAAPLVALAAA
ncbi:MAG: glycoside hydrolase family 2 protein [Burkholderiaceae bacterium]